MPRTNNDNVPTETLLKYVCRERDLYKRKLEQLIPYTKQLEVSLKELESKNEDTIKGTILTLNATHAKEVKRLKKQYKRLYNLLKTALETVEEP